MYRVRAPVWYAMLVLAALLMTRIAAANPYVPVQPPDPVLRELLRKAMHEKGGFKDRYDAEVWLLDMSNRLRPFVPNDAERLKLLRLVHYEATRVHLPPELVLAVINVESDFHRFAISEAGAEGLMQVMPFWLREIGEPGANLFDMRTNLRFGCTILRYYMDQAHGNITQALQLYNGSNGNTRYSTRVFIRLSERWFRQ